MKLLIFLTTLVVSLSQYYAEGQDDCKIYSYMIDTLVSTPGINYSIIGYDSTDDIILGKPDTGFAYHTFYLNNKTLNFSRGFLSDWFVLQIGDTSLLQYSFEKNDSSQLQNCDFSNIPYSKIFISSRADTVDRYGYEVKHTGGNEITFSNVELEFSEILYYRNKIAISYLWYMQANRVFIYYYLFANRNSKKDGLPNWYLDKLTVESR